MTMQHGFSRRLAKPAAALLALLTASSPALAQGSAAVKPAVKPPALVQSISVNGDEVRIGLSGPSSYEDFILSQPPRIVLQISNADYRLTQKAFPGRGALKEVRAGQFSTAPIPMTRVVLDLTKAIAYHVATDGDDLLVSLAAQAAGEVKAAARAPAAPKAKPAPRAPASVASLAPIDVMSRLPTDKITVDFDQTDVSDILRLFAAKARINIIYGPDVSGQLTLHLSDVPFDEAFRTVLNMLNLTTIQVGGNILRVLTPDTLAKVQTEAATATKIIPLDYSKSSDLAATIGQIMAAEKIQGTAIADSKTNSLIVTAAPDSLTQITHMVAQLDVQPKEVLIEAKLVEVALDNTLDYGIQWNSFGLQNTQHGTNVLGAPIGLTSNNSNGTINSSLLSNPLSFTGPTAAGVATTATSFNPVGAGGQGTGVSLPTVVPAFGALTLGRITNNYILNATLSAAASVGKVKILSDPKIATLNNQPANIDVTTQVPYVTTTVVPGNTGSGAVVPQTVNYATEGIQLTVTPIINADGRITLTINPNIVQPSATAAGNSATGAPATDTRSAQTTVMVKNGDTIVIGGLIHDSITNQVGKIPVLGDLPVIGWLFKNVHKVHTRNELLIFVTPQIMTE